MMACRRCMGLAAKFTGGEACRRQRIRASSRGMGRVRTRCRSRTLDSSILAAVRKGRRAMDAGRRRVRGWTHRVRELRGSSRSRSSTIRVRQAAAHRIRGARARSRGLMCRRTRAAWDTKSRTPTARRASMRPRRWTASRTWCKMRRNSLTALESSGRLRRILVGSGPNTISEALTCEVAMQTIGRLRRRSRMAATKVTVRSIKVWRCVVRRAQALGRLRAIFTVDRRTWLTSI